MKKRVKQDKFGNLSNVEAKRSLSTYHPEKSERLERYW